ncbi:MAG: DNA N-6-adenine-methyltransferase [Isosphaeraceae bacterium]|nr:DNA N-6-adenine-methyltransferase [Isosphaeraceae bacterium]
MTHDPTIEASGALVTITLATRMLGEARTLEDVRLVRDLAEALRTYARAHDLGVEAMNYATEIKLRAERKAGELLITMAVRGERRTSDDGLSEQVSGGATPARSLTDLGISRDQSADWQAIASLPEPAFEAYIAEAKKAGMLTSAALVKQARLAKGHRGRLDPLMTSDSPEWYSPRHVVEAARIALGGCIALDPCAEPARSVPAVRHFTAAEDGLNHQWVGAAYVNPPYGRTIGEWIRKLRTEYAEGRVTAAVVLLPARTDTDWWAELGAELVCLIHGRLTFSNAGSNAPFPSVAVYLGPDAESFAQAFAPLGPVFRRVAG